MLIPETVTCVRNTDLLDNVYGLQPTVTAELDGSLAWRFDSLTGSWHRRVYATLDDGTQIEVPYHYDLSNDTWEPVTQRDMDEIDLFFAALRRMPQPEPAAEPQDFSFRLATYPNPMRTDGVFVAEDKPVEPYKGIHNLDGSPCYPTIPQTPYMLGRQMEPAFARELVRRWNRGS